MVMVLVISITGEQDGLASDNVCEDTMVKLASLAIIMMIMMDCNSVCADVSNGKNGISSDDEGNNDDLICLWRTQKR